LTGQSTIIINTIVNKQKHYFDLAFRILPIYTLDINTSRAILFFIICVVSHGS
jgi:hypothetical protein